MRGSCETLLRRRAWLTASYVSRLPVASTRGVFLTCHSDAGVFVSPQGGGSRPLAGLRSGRLASPRFTSRISAGRSGAWRLSASSIGEGAWTLLRQWNSPRASRRRFRRETPLEAGSAGSHRVPVGHTVPAPVSLSLDASRRCDIPADGNVLLRRPLSSGVSRARSARFDARTATHRCGWAHPDACAGAWALHTPSCVFQTALWCAGAEPHPTYAWTAQVGQERMSPLWAKPTCLANWGWPSCHAEA